MKSENWKSELNFENRIGGLNMEIKLKINTDKILDETGITIDEPEQWLALMDRGIEAVKESKGKSNRRVQDLISLFDNVMMI